MDPGVEWLLTSRDPSVRYWALTDVLGRSSRSPDVREARAAISGARRVRALLNGQRRDGGFGNHPYTKWTGAHWRLVSLVELGVERHPKAVAAAETVLAWLADESLESQLRIAGLVRIHASIHGNALGYCTRLGLARDPRLRALRDLLLETQWPDGGWNCDRHLGAHTSSFYESITPMWGLAEYARATDDREARAASLKAAELFLERRLFRSKRTREVINERWLKLHYPLYWHYDVLHGLLLLARAGVLPDARANEAVDLVESRRRADGTWARGATYWTLRPGSNQEVVDWGTRGPNEMITLNALRVLRASGRLR